MPEHIVMIDHPEKQPAPRGRNEQAIIHQSKLLELSKRDISDFESFLKNATETAARTLGIERVGVWLLDEDLSALHCEDLYKLGNDTHEKGAGLLAKDYPRYFQALCMSRTVAADDALHDLRTSEFTEGYLEPLGISSMMDIPVCHHGRLAGVMCHEHFGTKRSWTIEEQDFSASIADRISLALEARERKQAEEALTQSEERFRQLADCTFEGIFFHDRGEILDFNQSALGLLGYEPNELVGKNVLDFVAPGSRELVIRSMQSGYDGPIEVMVQRKDGSAITFEVLGKATTYQGRPARVVALRDITERKQMEEKLRESERKYHDLVENLNDVIYSADAEGTITYVSHAVEALLGYHPAEVIGRQVFDLIYKEDRPRMAAQFQRIVSGVLDPSEYRLLKKSAEMCWVMSSSRPIYSGNTVLRIQGIVGDISDHKRAEEEKARLEAQLRHAQKLEAIGTLAGGIAHDFNNILSTILGFTEIALDDTPEDASSRNDLEQVLKAAHRAKKLVKQILAFSRQGQMQAREPIAVAPVVKEALRLLRATLPTTIEFRQDIPKDSGTITGDPTQLHQVVVNLCANAAHAMRERGGILEVALRRIELDDASVITCDNRRPRPYVKLTVRDTDHGMDSATLERIFDPYFTTKEVGAGSGLGLAVVHGIVKRHDGHVSVRSEPGKGTVFELLFPAVELPLETTEDNVQPLPGGKERVLFVDDEEPLVKLGERMLLQFGYRVSTAMSSLEAIELFREEPGRFDLVITDYTMPHMTGVDLAGEILRIRPDIPIVLCTGYTDMLSEKKVQELGIRTFVMKPLSRRNMAVVIRNVLDGKEP
jgi:PAS domain S-box-containing protein